MERYFIKNELINDFLQKGNKAQIIFAPGPLLDDFGFLYKSNYNDNIKSLNEIADQGNVMIIAECGMGKTYVMNSLQTHFEENQILDIKLGEFNKDISGLHSVFEKLSDDIQYVFIDGLDEAPEILSPLQRVIRGLPREIKFFIASRNIQQIEPIVESLNLTKYSLLPLTQDNIQEFALSEGVDGKLFLEEVIKKNLGSACAKPLGCKHLLTLFRRGELTSSNNDEIWKKVILTLCSENDSPTRRLNGHSDISASMCYEYAAKIALILKLSGHNVIKRIMSTAHDDKYIDFSEYCEETFREGVFNQILDRALFLPIGTDTFRFSHMSYFDFLVAEAMNQYIEPRHWRSIMLLPDRSAVFPQMEYIAARLTLSDSKWLKVIVDIQPELLLTSDVAIEKIGRDKVCQAILARSENLSYDQKHEPALVSRLFKLKDNKSIEILRNVFRPSVSKSQKEMAIAIIRECRMTELESYLIDIFCNKSEDFVFRQTAGYALANFATDEGREKCKTILSEEGCSQELKALLFRMTWPNLILVSELAPHLTDPQPHFIGAYYWWLVHELPSTLLLLSKDKIKNLLEWAISNVERPKSYHNDLLNVKCQIYTACWLKYDSDDFYLLFAQGFVNFQKIHCDPFSNNSIHGNPKELDYPLDVFLSDTSRRRKLAEYIIEQPEISKDNWFNYPHPCLNDHDIEFIFQKTEKNSTDVVILNWIDCLMRIGNGIDFDKYGERWNQIQQRFPDKMPSVEQINQWRKASHEELEKTKHECGESQKKIENENYQKRLGNIQFIKTVLANGTASQFFYHIIDVFIQETDLDRLDYQDTNIWSEFNDEEHEQLTIAARDFLLNTKVPASSDNSIYPAYSRAFYMLYTHNHVEFENLPDTVWQEFAFELLNYSLYDRSNALIPIFEYMSEKFPDIFVDALLKEVKKEAMVDRAFYYGKFKDLLPDDAWQKITALCDLPNMDDKKRFLILNKIKDLSSTCVEKYLRERLIEEQKLSKHGDLTILLFLLYFPEKMAEFISVLENDPAWGKKWLQSAMEFDGYDFKLLSCFTRSTLDELTRVYVWLHRNYPSNKAPDYNDDTVSNYIKHIYDFIQDIFSAIQQYNGFGVAKKIQEIYNQFPEDKYLKDVILNTRRSEINKLVPIYDIQTIKTLMKKQPIGDLVTSPQGLLDVVRKYLDKYQEFLTGVDTPRVCDLWNESEPYKHKSEEHLSDHLKSFLEQNLNGAGVIINREVQLHRGRDGETGAITDLWINTFYADQSDKISLCIEVKGSWNAEAKTGMKAQLAEKYMAPGGADAGIFLVGWFDSAKHPQHNQWNKDHNQAQLDLQLQAEELKKQGYLILSMILDCKYKK